MSQIEISSRRQQGTVVLLRKLAVIALVGVMVPLAAAPVARADAPIQNPPSHRLIWQYDGGFVADRGNGVWEETSPTRIFQMEEVRRHRSYIELINRSNNVTVRLYNDASYALNPDAPARGFVRTKIGHWRN
jgi:hypothetical protein